MRTIEESTQELIRSIQDTEEYQRYQKLREAVEADSELRGKLNAFRRRVYQAQTSDETLDYFSEQARLGADAAELRKNELVDEYLKMELHICRTIQKIAFELADAIDLDLDAVLE
ncbi:MAG: YlbF family regulator [Lachnospiraceae bacterium]|nr:YlbF family regulator [Lachnospiraceae bacterium]